MRYFALAALGCLLMGCQTTAERSAQDDAKCQSFGAPKGSKAYFDCRMALENNRSGIEASNQFGQGHGLIRRMIDTAR